jgi:hypothetical protein
VEEAEADAREERNRADAEEARADGAEEDVADLEARLDVRNDVVRARDQEIAALRNPERIVDVNVTVPGRWRTWWSVWMTPGDILTVDMRLIGSSVDLFVIPGNAELDKFKAGGNDFERANNKGGFNIQSANFTYIATESEWHYVVVSTLRSDRPADVRIVIDLAD